MARAVAASLLALCTAAPPPLPYDPARFETDVAAALAVTARVLGEARSPRLPAAVGHAYADKFALVEAQLSALAVSTISALEAVGLTRDALRTVAGWAAAGDSVTLRFNASTACSFVREESRDVEDRSTRTSVGGAPLLTTRAYTKVTEWVWEFTAAWALDVYRGTGRGAGDALPLAGRGGGRAELRTGAKVNPRPQAGAQPPVEASLTWLATAVDAGDDALPVRVRIDRASAATLTPRRNAASDAALRFARGVADWAAAAAGFVTSELWSAAAAAAPDVGGAGGWDADDLFVPALLFEEAESESEEAAGEVEREAGPEAAPESEPDQAASSPPSPSPAHLVLPPGAGLTALGAPLPAPTAPAVGNASAAPHAASPLMDLGSLNRLLAEGRDGLRARIAALAGARPPPASAALLTGAEASLAVAAAYARRAAVHASDGVNYVEAMLRDQVVAAVGKVVTPADFDAYMRFHASRLFRPEFEPRPLVFAVRRSSEHSPEGTLRVNDAPVGDSPAEPIFTVSVSSPASPQRPMAFALSAEARVRFGGEVLVHGWMATCFSVAPRGDEPPPRPGAPRRALPAAPLPRALSLVATARQFSSFVLLIGRISSPTTFEPTSAIIVKDKDEVTVPLAAAELPTPGEFRDAIASLSPEQARFATAFRAMQLQSTLFAVLVVHIKPALEAVLNLPLDALTKEVELTQALMDLFIQYQIPADLLAAPKTGDGSARLAAVKASVAAVAAMIAKAEDREVARRAKEEAYASPPGGATRAGAAAYVVTAGAVADADGAPAAARVGRAQMSFGARGFARGDVAVNAESVMAAVHMASAPPPLAPQPPPSPPPPSPPLSTPPQTPAHEPPAPGAAAPTAGPRAARGGGAADGAPPRDLTALPADLDAAFDGAAAAGGSGGGALRATVITPGGPWIRRVRAALLARGATTAALGAGEQASAHAAAFDLLDALSRSGALPLEHAALHVLLGATHGFDESLMDTVVRGNVNPVEPAERSLALIAATLHGRAAADLLRPDAASRLGDAAGRAATGA